MATISGLHHVTAIAGDPAENLRFYTGVLGMRLVKKSVNQDAPDTYHLFYADGAGTPGTDLTFFPWPAMGPARAGTGLAMEVSLAVPAGSLEYWKERLGRHAVALQPEESRRGSRVLPFRDPHGLPLALAETADPREFVPWEKSPVPRPQQVRGLHSVRLWQLNVTTSAALLTNVLGFSALGEEHGWHGFGVAGGGSGKLVEIRETPGVRRGEWGTGGVHHVAWRVPDLAAELALRQRIAAAHRRPTEPIDRFWFTSVYFREPGGVLFELATDGPGFTADESPESLGERLVLPPWLEPQRQQIEAALPPLSTDE